MKTVTSFPRPVRDIENVFIRLSDGSRLALGNWLETGRECFIRTKNLERH